MSDLLSHFDTQIQNQEQLLREREQELEQLRRQRDRLAELQTQRDDLFTQLRAIENDIALIERTMTSSLHRFGGTLAPTPAAAPSPLPPVPRVPEVPAPASPTPPAAPVTPAEPRTSSLREDIRKVLRAARGPLTGPEIATRVRAGGYKTTSSNFPNIVKKTLSEMDDVAHVRGQGYKLKK